MPPTVEEIVTAPWWPEMLAQKDSLSWAALTQRFGVNATALRRALESKGHTKAALPPGRKSRAAVQTDDEPMPPDPRELLKREAGKRPDSEVADSVGVSVDEVKAFRREHGIAPYLRPPPAAALPAAVVAPRPPAEPLKASAGSVLVRRRPSANGETAPQVRLETPAPAPAPSAPPVVVPLPAVVAPQAGSPLDAFRDQMGKVGDQVIANLAGVSRGTVGDYRRSLGIPAYQGYKFEPGHAPLGGGPRVRSPEREPEAKNPNEPGRLPAVDERAEAVASPVDVTAASARVLGPEPTTVASGREVADDAASASPAASARAERTFAGRVSKIDPFADLVGVLSDKDVAERAGVTTQNVRTWRERRGIPSAAEHTVEEAGPAAPAAPVEPQVQPVKEVAGTLREVEVTAEGLAASSRTRQVTEVDPLSGLHGYRVVASDGQTKRNYIVVAADMMDASRRAAEALSHREDGPWRIVMIKELAEALGPGL